MRTQEPTPVPSSLRQILDRIARPLDIIRQRDPSAFPIVKNLGAYVSTQVIQALSEKVQSPGIEARLLTLREIFRDEKPGWTQEEYHSRLSQAHTILSDLYRMIEGTPPKYAEDGQQGLEGAPHPNQASSPPQDSHIHSGDVPDQWAEKPLWTLPIQYAKGVGPKRAPLLEKLGLHTLEDAMWYVPWRYEDRSQIIAIQQLVPGTMATIMGVIHSARLRYTRRRGMTLFTMDVRDETGQLEIVFFNQPYLEQILTKGGTVILSGMVAVSTRKQIWQMKSPQYEVLDDEEEELLHVGRIIPIYHETRGITSRHLRRIIKGLLSQYLTALEEPLPLEIRQKHQLWTIQAAVQEVHFPETSHSIESLNTWGTQAHRRLAFEECFLLQIALALRQRLNQGGENGVQFQDAQLMIDHLRGQLPYQLTAAQLRVIDDIRRDMMSPKVMNRLIQGDVGSGKTVVALHAMVMACGSGYQAVLMAPTEILAEQHYLSMKEIFDRLGLKVRLVKGGPATKEKARILQHIKAGDIHVVIGTHALLQQNVAFAKLGMVVVDEQHKFGVLQRAALRDKGGQPDVLVMTATPIPRTLAMTAYGDLHVSVIDQLPPGRKPIQTLLFRRGERKRAYAQVREQITAGRQAYVVYPLVEESEKIDLEAAMQAAERLQTEEFPASRVGLLHGRMKSEEKAQTMKTFKEKGIDILVATTVIEVGLDVPNATVMVIEHAERFGLAQLHQLRGRVGRGPDESFCLLVSSAVRSAATKEKIGMMGKEGAKQVGSSLPLPMETKSYPTLERPMPTATQSAQQRLQAMATCADGFTIAEEDLRIRGPGEFLGVRQSGTPEFRVVDLIRDGKILEEARQEAFALIERDPELAHPDHQVLKVAMLRRWQKKFDLGTVG